MTNQRIGGNQKKKRVRSPNFPFINLEDAIKRTEDFYDREGRNWANIEIASKHWGYSSVASGGALVIAALTAFGLLEDEGARETRKVRLSEAGQKILLDKRPKSQERQAHLQKAALRPKIYGELWEKWGGALPSDQNIEYLLVSEMGFNPKSIPRFIEDFRHTLAFAGLSGKIPLEEPQIQPETAEDGENHSRNGSTAKVSFLPKSGMNQDVFTLEEGDVTIQWPKALSNASYKDLEDWLELIKRKAKRAIRNSPIQGNEFKGDVGSGDVTKVSTSQTRSTG